MASEKRPTPPSFGTSQLVKRQKSDANLGGSAVAVINGAQNGALIQAVCTRPRRAQAELKPLERNALADVRMGCLGTTHKCASVANHGVDW
jgi:hypothetical protein